MDKRALEKFATSARVELIEKVLLKAKHYGFTAKGVSEKRKIGDSYFVDDLMLTNKEEKAWTNLKSHINKVNTNDDYSRAFKSVIDEIAYTWFNRLVALRFMEVHNYLPTRVRVTSSVHGGADPDILREALNIDLDVDKEHVYALKQDNKRDELYKYMIIKQCEALTDILPFLFDKTHDYVELLFPDNLLADGAIIDKMINSIPEDNWDNVEIIGWLYQYYISEENKRVIQAKKRYKKEELAPATQLFTPDWIVRYMVQNALGRYYVEANPQHRSLIEDWEFYLENPNPEEDFEEKLAPFIDENKKLEEVKCFDPAMGSGHILVYMFDVLYKIYEINGYVQSEIPMLIIENNLYGLDIDDRAYQLACFCVVMKGREYDRRFFRRIQSRLNETGKYIELNLASVQETNNFNYEDLQYIEQDKSSSEYKKLVAFIQQFKDAKIYGSLTKVNETDIVALQEKYFQAKTTIDLTIFSEYAFREINELFPALLKQTEIMTKTYDVLVTNPPYVGNKYLNPKLNNFVVENYSDVKSDIFSAFIVYSLRMTKSNGQLGFMTPFVWMFIKSYEALRKKIIDSKTISSLIQLEYSGFEGATVPICTFTLRNYGKNFSGEFVRLSDFVGAANQPLKTREAVHNPKCGYRYTTKSINFTKVPGIPIAYWLSNKFINIFCCKPLSDVSDAKAGLQTNNNGQFLRMWYEVIQRHIGFNKSSKKTDIFSEKWFPYNKGGEYRKWYGNNEYVVNWQNNGYDIHKYNNIPLTYKGAPVRNKQYYFRKAITWTLVTSGEFGVRCCEQGFIFDIGAHSIFCDDSIYNYVAALLNSKISKIVAKILNPTLNLSAGVLSRFPYKEINNKEYIDSLVIMSIKVSKTDWDSFETSWDFTIHPLLKFGIFLYSGLVDYENLNNTSPINIGVDKTDNSFKVFEKGMPNNGLIETSFKMYSDYTNEQFNKLKSNEEEINRIFIDIYDLADELTPDFEDKDVTIYRVVESKEELDYKSNYILDRSDVIKSFISYAVGCMLGRYSPYKEGLIYAGGEWNYGKIQDELWEAAGEHIKEKLERSENGMIVGDFILPDVDNVIPITDDNYFSDDIVGEFVKFVKECFGEEHLDENIEYIADSLNPKNSETPKETIRRYFLNDFYKDHVQTYKKRPIYWLFTSGKQKAFNALIYMHRYDKSTLARIRTDYLHRQQNILEAKRSRLVEALKTESNKREEVKLNKEIATLDKQLDEMKAYDEKLHHLADKMIEIDLDDGVVENYKLFDGLVGKI